MSAPPKYIAPAMPIKHISWIVHEPGWTTSYPIDDGDVDDGLRKMVTKHHIEQYNRGVLDPRETMIRR